MITSTPHEYLKRDPHDIERDELAALLKETLGMTFEHAREHENLPPPDYTDKGRSFWWSPTFLSWFRPTFEAYQVRVLHAAQLSDAKFHAARAAYERGQL